MAIMGKAVTLTLAISRSYFESKQLPEFPRIVLAAR
jgi:hypothetical protein